MRDVATDQLNNGLEDELTIDRDTASRLGIFPQAIDNTLYDAFGQRQVSTIFTQLNQYHVMLEVLPSFAQTPEAMNDIYVRPAAVTSELGRAHREWRGGDHQRRSRSDLDVHPHAIEQRFARRQPSGTIPRGHAFVQPCARSIARRRHQGHRAGGKRYPVAAQHSRGISGDGGRISEFAGLSEPFLILAAIITVYIVLGVLYESYIHPITILSTLPSAGVGAILALMLTGNDLTVVALIGIILLIGIVKKNAIMMIDFALEAEREEHKPPEEAIFQACLLRFRPIMMTTMAALLGGLPLALGSGTGAELRRPSASPSSAA